MDPYEAKRSSEPPPLRPKHRSGPLDARDPPPDGRPVCAYSASDLAADLGRELVGGQTGRWGRLAQGSSTE